MKRSVSIVFGGDIGFDRYMKGKWEDDALLSSEVLDFLHMADHVVANVEGAMVFTPNDGEDGMFVHTMDARATHALRRMGADIWCIANNHIMDAGALGLDSTLAIAGAEGALTVGAGVNLRAASKPVYIDGAGGIGIIAVGYNDDCKPATENSHGVLSWDDFLEIEDRIREIKRTCRYCVVIAHGGEEFAALPLPYTRDRYIKYLELGADVVIGHHPHVPENYESFAGGKKIFYSLGNFIFDTDYQRAHAHTDEGVLLKLTFTESGYGFEAVGLVLDRALGRISAAKPGEIFTDISAEEYARLSPLAARAFVCEEKRKMVFLHPEIYENATDTVWQRYFEVESKEECVRGAHMDFDIILPLAGTAALGEWKKSELDAVKTYLLDMCDD